MLVVVIIFVFLNINIINGDHGILKQNSTYCYEDNPDVHDKILYMRNTLKKCFFMIPLRDDFMDIYTPRKNESYFNYFYDNIVTPYLMKNETKPHFALYNLEKYQHLTTDVIFFFCDKCEAVTMEDFISTNIVKYFEDVEGDTQDSPWCLDRDSDFIRNFYPMTGCILAFMNRSYYAGPTSFNSFFSDYVERNGAPYTGIEFLHDTFMREQSEHRGCQYYIKGKIQEQYLQEGQCTGSLSLTSFDLLCCCYLNPYLCSITAPHVPFKSDQAQNEMNSLNQVINPIMSDDMFLCIKGELNRKHQVWKFYGILRDEVLTTLSKACYVRIYADLYDDLQSISLKYVFGGSNGSDEFCQRSLMNTSIATSRISRPADRAVYNYSITSGAELTFCCLGHICNHFDMYYPEEFPQAFRQKFELFLPKNLDSGCGYLPLYLLELLTPNKRLTSCAYSVGISDLTEVFLDIYSFSRVNETYLPERHSRNGEEFLCFYYEKKPLIETNEMTTDSKMYYGCQFPKSFVLEYTSISNYTALSNAHFTALLRKEFLEHGKLIRCIHTNHKPIDLFTFTRLDEINYSKLASHYPICYALSYMDSSFTQVISGPCTPDLQNAARNCCNWGYAMRKYIIKENVENKQMSDWYISKVMKMDQCTDKTCLTSSMDGRCYAYYGIETDGLQLAKYFLSRKVMGFNIKNPEVLEQIKPSGKVESVEASDNKILLSSKTCLVDQSIPQCKTDLDEYDAPLSCITRYNTTQQNSCSVFEDKIADSKIFFLCFTLPRSNHHDFQREFIVLNGTKSFIYRCSLKFPHRV